MNPYPANTTPPSSASAREAALWLLGASHQRILPPVASALAVGDDVVMTLDPAEAWQWTVWSNFLDARPETVPAGCGCVKACGSWHGVRVVLVGEHPERWATA